MRFLPAPTRSPIGLDLGAHSFKAVQLRRSGARWKVAAAVSLPRVAPAAPLTAGEISRLVGVLERRGFFGSEAVLALPAAGVLSAILELPARAPGVPLDRIAAAEFGRVHKLESVPVAMTAWELPAPARASRATSMIAVGARSDGLEAHVELVESAGLDVVGVDEPYSAVARGAFHAAGVEKSEAAGLTAVVDLGWDAVRLAIVHGRTLAYTRKLADAGLAAVVRAASGVAAADLQDTEAALWRSGLGVDPDRDSAVADVLSGHLAGTLREIGLAFGYAARQYPTAPLTAVLLAGGGASVPGLPARFAESLGVPARPAGDVETPAALALAAGLALSEVTR